MLLYLGRSVIQRSRQSWPMRICGEKPGQETETTKTIRSLPEPGRGTRDLRSIQTVDKSHCPVSCLEDGQKGTWSRRFKPAQAGEDRA